MDVKYRPNGGPDEPFEKLRPWIPNLWSRNVALALRQSELATWASFRRDSGLLVKILPVALRLLTSLTCIEANEGASCSCKRQIPANCLRATTRGTGLG